MVDLSGANPPSPASVKSLDSPRSKSYSLHPDNTVSKRHLLIIGEHPRGIRLSGLTTRLLVLRLAAQ